jgi:transcriptional regulator with GAF, ATPase, and Fis domain
MSKAKRAMPEEQALRLVVEGTMAETGTEFFRALHNLGGIVGQSAGCKEVPREVEQVAATDAALRFRRETAAWTTSGPSLLASRQPQTPSAP